LKFLPKFLITLILASLVIVGCSQQVATPVTDYSQTAAANTMAVMQSQINDLASTQAAAASTGAEAATVVATEAPTALPTATAAPVVESTPVPTATPLVISNPGSTTSSGPSYRVGSVVDLNYPDGTYMDATMFFTKQWSIKNVGTGTWPKDTKVVAVDKNPLQAGEYTLGQVVSPGQTVTIKLPLRAPETIAKYQGKFMLELPDGTRFGIGPNFDQPFWVTIYTH
jgi:hypothetical protein